MYTGCQDLSRPERIFQLCHPDLPVEFPPLRSLDARLHNLPVQRTSFVGRQDEMAEVKRLVADEALVTLVGSGGCGKTRLAVHAAAEVLDDYPDGVWLADLAAVADRDVGGHSGGSDLRPQGRSGHDRHRRPGRLPWSTSGRC